MTESSQHAAVSTRRVHPADAPALQDFYAHLSPASRRARFLGPIAGLNATQSRSFCSPDHVHREGFVAVSRSSDGTDNIVGHLCLEPAALPRTLELALAVADAEQGRGIGRALFVMALDWARDRGYSSIAATCLTDNSRVLRLLTSAPFGATVSQADCGVVDVLAPLSPAPPADRTWAPTEVAARRHVTRVRRSTIHAIWMAR